MSPKPSPKPSRKPSRTIGPAKPKTLSLDELQALSQSVAAGDEAAIVWTQKNMKALDRAVGEVMEFNPARMAQLIKAAPGPTLADEVESMLQGLLARSEHDNVMAPNIIAMTTVILTEVCRRLRAMP